MNTIRSFSDHKGISRMLSSWYHVDTDAYYRDDEHGGKAPALVALLLDRIKSDMKKSDLVSQKLGSPRANVTNQTGVVGVTKKNKGSKGNAYYTVHIGKVEKSTYMNIPIEKYGNELAFRAALQVRHWYCHYVYGELYHKKRKNPENNLPVDSLLEKHNIKPMPDFEPYQYSKHYGKKEGARTNARILHRVGRTSENDTYDKFPHLKRVQGVCYVDSVKAFCATFPVGTNENAKAKSFTISAHGVDKAYAMAVNARHQFCKEHYGEDYETARQNESNILPSDETLQKIGINA